MAGLRIPQLPVMDPTDLAPEDQLVVFDESAGLTKSLPVGAFSDPVSIKANAVAIGIAADDEDMGVFTGEVIPNNATAKAALQALENAYEAAGVFLQAGYGAVPRATQDKMRERISLADYGFSTTNTSAQNKAAVDLAIAALPAAGGTLCIGLGAYAVDMFDLPPDPKVIDIQGSGAFATELQMGTPAGPLIRKQPGTSRITGARIGGFTIRAHGASDKTNLGHIAVKTAGFGKGTFHDIRYMSSADGTGTSGSVGVLFEAESFSAPCYQNVMERIQVTGCYGPSRVVRCHEGGGGVGYNPNLIELRDSWIYGVAGMDLAFDGYDSTRSKICNTLFEDCSGATAIGMGQCCIVEGNWFELFATNLRTAAAGTTDGSGAIVIGNYFSGAGTSFIDSIGQKPLWIGNNGGGQTVTGAGVTMVQGALAPPAAPTLAVSNFGAITGLTLSAATLARSPDALGRLVYHLVYTGTPASVNITEFTITPPSGFVVEAAVVGATRNADGKPVKACIGTNANGCVHQLNFEATDAHVIVSRVTMAPA